MKNIKFVETVKTEKQIHSKTCDICEKEFKNPKYYNTEEFTNGFDEFIDINVNAGYGSNYLGDGTSISLNICEKCFVKKILKKTKNGKLEETFNYSEKDIKNIKWSEFVEKTLNKLKI